MTQFLVLRVPRGPHMIHTSKKCYKKENLGCIFYYSKISNQRKKNTCSMKKQVSMARNSYIFCKENTQQNLDYLKRCKFD